MTAGFASCLTGLGLIQSDALRALAITSLQSRTLQPIQTTRTRLSKQSRIIPRASSSPVQSNPEDQSPNPRDLPNDKTSIINESLQVLINKRSAGQSRYESYYTEVLGNVEDGYIDVSSFNTSSSAFQTESAASTEKGDEPPMSVPFFVGYDNEELQSLLNIHGAFFGLEPVPDKNAPPKENKGSFMGGLQELIMKALEEGTQGKEDSEDKESESFK